MTYSGKILIYKEIAMLRKIVLFSVLLGLVLVYGCVDVKVDEPLVDLGNGDYSRAAPDPGEPADETQILQYLRHQLAQAKLKIKKQDREIDELENELDRCEDKVDDLEDKIEDLKDD